MIEINGWIVISESYNEESENGLLLNSIIEKIKNKISEKEYFNELYTLKPLNGTYHLSIMANHNHRNENTIDFFKWISKISLGSYGVLYVKDDEDLMRKNENKFKVWTMKKGIVCEMDDYYLSPINPEIEE